MKPKEVERGEKKKGHQDERKLVRVEDELFIEKCCLNVFGIHPLSCPEVPDDVKVRMVRDCHYTLEWPESSLDLRNKLN